MTLHKAIVKFTTRLKLYFRFLTDNCHIVSIRITAILANPAARLD